MPIQLRPIAANDLDFFVQMYASEEIMQFIGRPLTVDQCQQQLGETINTMNGAQPHHVTFVIERLKTRLPVGITGLTWFDPENRSVAAVGVMIQAAHRRQRIAHRAKQMMIDAGFNGYSLEKICAFCQINNVAANTANARLRLHKGRIIEDGVNHQISQEWFIEKSQWNQSYLHDI